MLRHIVKGTVRCVSHGLLRTDARRAERSFRFNTNLFLEFRHHRRPHRYPNSFVAALHHPKQPHPLVSNVETDQSSMFAIACAGLTSMLHSIHTTVSINPIRRVEHEGWVVHQAHPWFFSIFHHPTICQTEERRFGRICSKEASFGNPCTVSATSTVLLRCPWIGRLCWRVDHCVGCRRRHIRCSTRCGLEYRSKLFYVA